METVGWRASTAGSVTAQPALPVFRDSQGDWDDNRRCLVGGSRKLHEPEDVSQGNLLKNES